MLSPEEQRTLARSAGGKRRQGRHEEADAIRATLAVATVEEKIRRAVEAAPPLPAEVADRLVTFIRAAADSPARRVEASAA